MPQGDWNVRGSSLTQPPFAGDNDPSIVIFPDPIPQAVRDEVHSSIGATWEVIACVLYRRTSTLYWFEALARPSAPSSFGDLAIVRGAIDSSIGATGQIWSYSSIIGGNRHRYGTDPIDLDIRIGDPASCGITITKVPFTIPAHMTIGAGSGAGDGTVDIISGDAGVGFINLTSGVNGGGVVVTGAHLIAPPAIGREIEIQDVGGSAISVPRGQRGSSSSTSNSAAVGTTETVIVTISNFVWRANRAYRCEYGPSIVTSLTTNVGQFRIRKTNAAGTLWGNAGAHGPSGSSPPINAMGQFFVRRNTGSDLTATIVLTLQAQTSGTATQQGTADTPRYLTVVDVGHAADHPFAFAVT